MFNAPDKSMWHYREQTLDKYSYDRSGQIEYSFNSNGFRDSEFTFDPEYVFFGCSSVFGVGIQAHERFSSYFANSYNLGLETDDSTKFDLTAPYSNTDILETIYSYYEMMREPPGCKMAVVWTDRDHEPIDLLIGRCNKEIPYKIYHFKVGKHNSEFAINLAAQVDQDVSKTHAGPKTHKLWRYQISKTFNQ